MNSFYTTCKQTIIKNFILPEFLCFIFDLSDEFELDNMHFINLINLKIIIDLFLKKNLF